VAQRFTSPAHWPLLRKVIYCFLLSGCLQGVGPEIVGGHDAYRTRFIQNPETGGVADLGRLEDDTPVSPDEVRGWERDLGCIIPKPWDD
jgi:hypothetical protein